MADLPSILGGMAQGFLDFGKSAVDLFGTSGAAVGDLVDTIRTGKVSTKNQDDFRKWLYNTDSVQDAAAKGLGTALNGVQTVTDYIPGIGAVTRNPLFNAGQGALGGLADEFKTYGKDYDLGRAGERAAVSAGAALASGGLGDALKKSANPLLSSGAVQGLARGATGGAITGGGYAAIDGGDIAQSALQGAGTGALIGGATGAMQDFMPRKATYDMALTDDERQARIANAQKQIDDIGPVSLFSKNPDDIAKRARISELQGNIRAYQNGYDTAQEYADAMAAKSANRANTQSATATQDQVYAPNMGEMDYGAPVQDGYTRLYRGMTQEFDPQYNRNAMDNMNGYESWTDNYDLANRYGDGKYVYSVDVPTSRIASSLYDENPNSATYGDRNFIASIEKPASLDGITGNEYLLNTNDELRSGLTYNRVNAPKALETTLANADMAVNSPKLTPEQEAYFKDSVMRDSNGNLMPVYHSSPNKFTEFDDARLGNNTAYDNTAFGHFVTNDRDFSSRFRDIDNKGIDGYTMELYADVKNPITHPYQASGKYQGADLDNIVKRYYEATDNPEALAAVKDWADESGQSLYEAYMDMTVDENPFEAAATERDLLRNKGYDAVEFVEGLKNELVDGSTDKTPISSYAIFGGNQLKDINNLTPTDAPSIMESRIAPEELDLARALANQDMAVNGVQASKIAPGQSLEKTLANGDAEINRVGSANVAPVDPTTLPDSLKAVQDYLDEGNYIKDIENFAGKPYPKLTNQDYLDYAISLKNPKDKAFYESIIKDMVDDGTTTYEKYAASAARNNRLNKLRMGSYDDIDPKALASYVANHRQALSNGAIRDVDAELSDRLGIGRSNTLMMDNNLPPDALGVYDPTKTALSIDTRVPEENAINTLAHERLHSFQTEGDFKRYDKRVTDAYEELSKDLNKYLKTPEETAKRYAFDTDYWGNEREQQSRMLQQYLENKGFTRGGLQKSNVGEWGNEINPAFDKFFDKLRDLSKRGVALPALAALFGGGAYMASQNNDKEKEVK